MHILIILILKHAEKKYLNNVLNLSAVNIAILLSGPYDEKVENNQQVGRNRYVLFRIINCTKFCGAFELALSDKWRFLGISKFYF